MQRSDRNPGRGFIIRRARHHFHSLLAAQQCTSLAMTATQMMKFADAAIQPNRSKRKHFAVFPEALVEPCIKVGTSEFGCCAQCGMPLRRSDGMSGGRFTCEHDGGDVVPCTVLDPFMGSGTTGAVAKRLGRNFVGIEINEQDCLDAAERIVAIGGVG